jgi:hypothetical protein
MVANYAHWRAGCVGQTLPANKPQWPPNRKLMDITVSYNVADNCGPECVLSVTSNEPENVTGDGDTVPDWVIVAAPPAQA